MISKIALLAIAILAGLSAFAQQGLRLRVIQADRSYLHGATASIPSLKRNETTDSNGIAVFQNLASGNYLLRISHAGFLSKNITVTIPVTQPQLDVLLEPIEKEEEEVIVQSTRTSRTIRNVPTRVEVIGAEEIDEKTNMRPSNVSMLLHESTGIQVQQTSATNGNASIRIQGLDGRYTQLLKDGFANFGNFASGLSVLEIPPLDLKQVEIIKGPSSTLYGGGAIAGVVNFISKEPAATARYNILLNQSNVGQSNLGYFSSHRKGKFGYTLLAQLNRQRAYDVDRDDFTELPDATDFTIHPKFFYYPDEKNTVIVGNSFTKSRSRGGDIQVVKRRPDANHQYFEENRTTRNITTFEWRRKMRAEDRLTLKQSLSLFDRQIRVPGYEFAGVSYSSFTDASLLWSRKRHGMVAGVNVLYDRFNEKKRSMDNRDATNLATGIYFQDTWDASENLKLESGIRLEQAHNKSPVFSRSEWFVLPRFSLLLRFNSELSSRIGAGMGYKSPTLFTERTEVVQYQGVQLTDGLRSERSYGATGDINFHKRVGIFDFSLNQLFFITRIHHPIQLQEDGAGALLLTNAAQALWSRGFETNAKLIFYNDIKLFLGYTYTDARSTHLVPAHKLNSALVYEKENNLKLGLEGYYTSPQLLYNGMRTSSFWEFGAMAEKIFRNFSVFINFENFTDTRQSRYKPVVSGPHTSPIFDDIWTHTEGFVINGGIKLKW